jgi:hypothetical protein
MKKKYGTFDGYLAADVLTVLTAILLFLALSKKVGIGLFAISGFATFGSLIYATMIGKTVLKNDTNRKILCKDEYTSAVETCGSGQSRSDIDGFRIEEPRCVYKVPDGVHVIVGDNGVKVRSLWGRLLFKYRGGIQNTPPDNAWEPLFRA